MNMDLGRTQALSLATKAITTALGVIQSFIVIRLLGPADFGLVGLVMSIGGVIGVSQHLGIVDGAIREIAVLRDKREIGKVFWVSHIVRQAVTVPLSIGLVLLAGVIAGRVYGRPEITLYLQVFAAALILQGLQDVLGASLTGLKKFGVLYGVQIATAAINILMFGLLTWWFGVAGFFWAIIVTTSVMVGWFAVIIARELAGHLSWPTGNDMRKFGRRVLRIGAYMYMARISFVVWQRLPLLMLGGVLTAEELGFLNVSLTFGARLTIIAMALSEVNLSWMSSLFVRSPNEFRRVAARNMQRVFMVMFGLTAALIFFTPEILLIIGREFIPAEPLIYVMTFAFLLYSLLDIGTSSVFVPADRPRLRAGVYAIQLVISAVIIGWLLLTNPSSWLATWGVLAGVAAAYFAMIVLVRRRFQIQLLPMPLAILLALLAGSIVWLFQAPGLVVRILVFVFLAGVAVWQARRSGLVPSLEKIFHTSPRSLAIICFAGAPYDLPYWTNRQHIMTRVAQRHPVLYVEPRVWIVRYLLRHWKNPKRVLQFLWRLVGWSRRGENLFLVSQWNLIPGSRENRAIAAFNHWLNRWRVVLVAHWLGFWPRMRGAGDNKSKLVAWIYDTEAAEYLSAFPKAVVFYDCVDDHAAQAGMDRNPKRVQEEENAILKRADLVTVTSKRLFEMMRERNRNVHLVLNAGDVSLFLPSVSPSPLPSPYTRRGGQRILGTVGSLDGYKFDFELLEKIARQKPEWNITLIGELVVDRDHQVVERLSALPNVNWLGAIPREKVPGYVHQFDVCLIPYRANQYNAASFPLKFWEFMASGKPIVVSGVPELKEYQPLIAYAENADKFIQMCEVAFKEGSVRAAERIALAKQHGWEQRAERLLSLLKNTIKKR